MTFRLNSYTVSSGLDLVKLKRDEDYKNCREHFCTVKTIVNDKLSKKITFKDRGSNYKFSTEPAQQNVID